MARFHLEHGPIPLHHQVYLDVRAALDAGEWRPGDQLPPERELAGRYGCSLITVRRALGDLAREGRLQRTRGRGTIVTLPKIIRDLSSTLSFAQEMALQGLEPGTKLLGAVRARADETAAAALDIEPGAPTYRLERLRSAGGLPLLLEQVELPADPFPDLLTADLEHGSLYDFLAARYGCQIVSLRETIEPVLPPSREAGLLNQSPRRPMLLLVGTAYTDEGRPVEYSRTYVPGDRSKLLIETRGRWARGLRSIRGTAKSSNDSEDALLLAGDRAGDRASGQR